jgi:hypothetical protein
MATENNHGKKESVSEKSVVPNEMKATEAEKSEAVPASATDKLNDSAKAAGNVFTKAKGLANDAIKTAKSDATKQSLNDAAKTAGVIGSKLLAKAKVVAEDVKKELKEVNDIRKDTFANAEAGTSKKALAKGFWAKLSGKQKGLLIGITAICIYFSYSVLFGESLIGSRPSLIDSTNERTIAGSCQSVALTAMTNAKDLKSINEATSIADIFQKMVLKSFDPRDSQPQWQQGYGHTISVCQAQGSSENDCSSENIRRAYGWCVSKVGVLRDALAR